MASRCIFRQLAENLHRQKKPLFHSWFQFLLLLTLVLFILCYALSSCSPSSWENLPLREHYQRFFNRTNRVNLPPPYGVRLGHKVKTNEIQQSTQPPSAPAPLPAGSTRYHLAYPQNYQFIMDVAEVCQTNTPFLVLMVPVEPKNLPARDAIRQTWGKEILVKGETVLTLFMMGLAEGAEEQEKLHQENMLHHDMIQSNFVDSYFNLTIKTMVIMDWLATRCPTAAYSMKIDSDMFLNIDNLVIMLQRPSIPKVNYLTGKLMFNRPVVRSFDSKWYVPREIHPDSKYPTYALGMGYVFSNDLSEKFVETSKSIKPFNIEDAYIGTCMKKLRLKPSWPPFSSQFQAYNIKYDRCAFSKVITYILRSPDELVEYWADLKKPGSPC